MEKSPKQVVLNSHDALPVRRKLGALMDALQGDGVHLIESHVSPDSFLAGDGTPAIVEVDRGRAHEPEFRIEFTSNTLFQDLGPREAPADSQTTDVTDMATEDVLKLVGGKPAV